MRNRKHSSGTEMLYYRYRSPSELSFKELLYSEIYFSPTEECNDPFDSGSFYEFGPDHVRWEKLFKLSLGQLGNPYPLAASRAAAEIVKWGSITFDQTMSLDFAELFRVTIEKDDPFALSIAVESLSRTLNLYKPQSSYFVSFSKRCDEPLMWSHYGGQHEGYCLVFRSIGGALRQNPVCAKTSLRRDTPNSFSPSTSYAIPDRFMFRDIDYVEVVEHLDAFDRFPQSVAMKKLSEEDRQALYLKQEKQYFQKHASWRYEAESRITLRAPEPWLFGDRFEYTCQERLFQYDPSQLVGVIFGARMSENNRTRILQIAGERADCIARQASHTRVLFDFLVQEAKLSTRQREVEISPIQFVGRVNSAKHGDEKFDLALHRWLEGEGYRD